ncbi:hypothetical protein [Sphingomonas hankookensis]|uniref:hypothetical protein n=1 Tax=Sphingomonas hankookensis TaxID=563996 RepID=UPI003F7A36E5
MRRLALSLLVPLLLAAGGGLAQTTMEQARREGNDLGRTMRGNGANTPGQGQLGELPGYQGTTLPESTYFSDPDRLTAEARPIANANADYRTVTDADNTRPRFSSAEIEDVTRRGMTIAKDPDTYLDGQQLGARAAPVPRCRPAPATRAITRLSATRGPRSRKARRPAPRVSCPRSSTRRAISTTVSATRTRATALPAMRSCSPR